MSQPSLPLSPSERRIALAAERDAKMAKSAHAYVRGSTAQFYAWLEQESSSSSIPTGPAIWICGDCHTGNLGPVADLRGKVDIQIRDFDQTVVGNPSHDLLRLALSLAMAARSSDLPGVTTALMIEAMIAGYTRLLSGQQPRIAPDEVVPIREVLRDALKRKWRHLAQERIEDRTPRIPLGDKFWPLSDRERKGLIDVFENKEQRHLFRCLTVNDPNEPVIVHDAAYWVKGCSSLGRGRYAVLAGTKKKFRLLDVKEAAETDAPAARGASFPKSNADRVVAGASQLSPFLGQRMIPTSMIGKEFFVKELRPQDLKFDLSEITQKQAVLTARLFGSVLGRGHSRQMTADIRRKWAKALRTGHSKALTPLRGSGMR